MPSMKPLKSDLILIDGAKTKQWVAELEGVTLVQTTWTNAGKPKRTTRNFATEEESVTEFQKLQDKRFLEGYARLVPLDSVEPGETVFECYGPVLHDMSADGKLLAVARYGAAKNPWCRLDLVDTTSGARRALFEEPGTKDARSYLHAAMFDETCRSIVVLLNTNTYRYDLETGARQQIAGSEKFRTSNYNPYVVRPTQDYSRRRLALFDVGDIVRVVEAGRTILEVSTAWKTTVCWAGRISPSGKLLALSRASRGLKFQHTDAKADPTNEVVIWDIDTGKILTTIPMSEPVSQSGFAAVDERLLVSLDHCGPAAFSLKSGKMEWRFGGPGRTHDSFSFGWIFSPDGSLLAVGRSNEVCLYRGDARTPVAYPDSGAYRAERIFFSANGDLFAAQFGRTISVRKTP